LARACGFLGHDPPRAAPGLDQGVATGVPKKIMLNQMALKSDLTPVETDLSAFHSQIAPP
jgi:hypothetical protein